MSFLNPLALLGLAAAAIPALLHLLQRRVPPELEFPAVRYLDDAERRSARRLRLRHLLLLLLRTALIVLVVLAAARPLVPARGGGAVHAPTALVVILDNSPSAGAVVDGRPVLDRLRAAALAVLSRLAPGDRAWLVLADGVARAGSREGLVASVGSATVDARRLDLAAAVRQAVRLVDAEPLPAREVHVISDLQRTALGAGRAEVPAGVRVLALAPLGAAPPNRGIAAARVVEGGIAVTVTGTPGTSPAPITVRVRGRDVGRGLVAPGATLTLPLPPTPPGWWVGEVELAADELRADDRRPFVWRVAPAVRATAGPEAGPFVAAALAVLRDAGRLARDGTSGTVRFGERPGVGGDAAVVFPPADPALTGQANRALSAKGVPWRFAAAGSPGQLSAPSLPTIATAQVTRRLRLEPAPGASAAEAAVLATVNGEPWLVRSGSVVVLGSRLDTAWTSLPATPGFVPFVDALANRVSRGEAVVTEEEGPPRVAFDVRGGGSDTVAAIVFGADSRESDLTPAPPELVRRVLGADLMDSGKLATAAFAGTRRADASGLLLALALLLALVELGVATLAR